MSREPEVNIASQVREIVQRAPVVEPANTDGADQDGVQACSAAHDKFFEKQEEHKCLLHAIHNAMGSQQVKEQALREAAQQDPRRHTDGWRCDQDWSSYVLGAVIRAQDGVCSCVITQNDIESYGLGSVCSYIKDLGRSLCGIVMHAFLGEHEHFDAIRVQHHDGTFVYIDSVMHENGLTDSSSQREGGRKRGACRLLMLALGTAWT